MGCVKPCPIARDDLLLRTRLMLCCVFKLLDFPNAVRPLCRMQSTMSLLFMYLRVRCLVLSPCILNYLRSIRGYAQYMVEFKLQQLMMTEVLSYYGMHHPAIGDPSTLL